MWGRFVAGWDGDAQPPLWQQLIQGAGRMALIFFVYRYFIGTLAVGG